MLYFIKSLILALVLLGCSTSTFSLSNGDTSVSLLPLHSNDKGYKYLSTRVITSTQEYSSFLAAIDAQSGWDHKVAFGITMGKAKIDFKKENLIVYRYRSVNKAYAKTVSIKEGNAKIAIEESTIKIGAMPQAFFYKVSKKIKKLTFKSKQRVDTVKNSKNSSVIPRECIAWFDGCNHCIRSNIGKTMCTKRHCKKKGEFRCVKWK